MKLGFKALGTVGALIGTYLIVAHATGVGTLIAKAGTAGSGVFKTLQGR
jgi:hypothetical protein